METNKGNIRILELKNVDFWGGDRQQLKNVETIEDARLIAKGMLKKEGDHLTYDTKDKKIWLKSIGDKKEERHMWFCD